MRWTSPLSASSSYQMRCVTPSTLARLEENFRTARAAFGALVHRGASIQSDDVMTILFDRHRDPAGPAAELEDRPTRSAREAAEPLDVRSSLERRGIEVVERREARGLGRVAFGALPVTRLGHRAPPSCV